MLLVSLTAFALVRTGELSNVYFAMVIELASIGGWHFPLVFHDGLRKPDYEPLDAEGLHPLAKVVTL